MSSRMAQFVGSKAQDNNRDPKSLTSQELKRRKALAMNAKVLTRPSETHYTQHQSSPDRHVSSRDHMYDRSPERLKLDEGDIFAASELGDSDDTTRDLSFQEKQSPHDGGLIGQDLVPQNHYKEEDDGYDTNIRDGTENGVEEEGLRPNSLPYHNGAIPLNTEAIWKQVTLCQESEQFKIAQKVHTSKYGPSQYPPIVPALTGRFTPANIEVADVGRQHTGLGYVNTAPNETHSRWDDHPAMVYWPDDPTDRYIPLKKSRRGNQGQQDDAEIAIRNGSSPEYGSNGMQEDDDGFGASALESDFSGESSPTNPSQHTPRANEPLHGRVITSGQAGKRKKVSLELDYDANVLSGMEYSELKSQPFDSNPRLQDDGIPALLKTTNVPLEDLLQELRGSRQDDQEAFFLHMPLDQWEKSGEWFLARFSDLMYKIRDARRAKRDISKHFEEELSNWEEIVRGQTENLQQVFKQMKEGGEGVLKGKTP